jgi:RNA polymerase sigma factor (sigma-70 family)
MNALVLDSRQLGALLERHRQADSLARNEIVETIYPWMRQQTRSLFRGFARLRGGTTMDDVAQEAVLRLLVALAQVQPVSASGLPALARTQIRRKLLDLCRRHQRDLVRYRTDAAWEDDAAWDSAVAEKEEDTAITELWPVLHQEIERLPALEREIFGLQFYHGWPQARVADLLQITRRTLQRKWRCVLRRMRQRQIESA